MCRNVFRTSPLWSGGCCCVCGVWIQRPKIILHFGRWGSGRVPLPYCGARLPPGPLKIQLCIIKNNNSLWSFLKSLCQRGAPTPSTKPADLTQTSGSTLLLKASKGKGCMWSLVAWLNEIRHECKGSWAQTTRWSSRGLPSAKPLQISHSRIQFA